MIRRGYPTDAKISGDPSGDYCRICAVTAGCYRRLLPQAVSADPLTATVSQSDVAVQQDDVEAPSPLAPQRAQIARTPQFNLQTSVMLPAAQTQNLSADVNHGQFVQGVLGCLIAPWGSILKVFPGSDLNNFGIHRLDRIIAFDGHRLLNTFSFVNYCVGPPGSVINLSIKHDGQVVTIPVKRTDARLYTGYDHTPFLSTPGHYGRCAAQDRFW